MEGVGWRSDTGFRVPGSEKSIAVPESGVSWGRTSILLFVVNRSVTHVIVKY